MAVEVQVMHGQPKDLSGAKSNCAGLRHRYDILYQTTIVKT